ncbi:hypothetical protein [Bosea sp. ANAM02]|uniref:hypothetical protein n=1 Tax=Bosea sp. ANAM02 TaxID=2020412 RepID=UPI00140EBE9A|nr:hypothetical protein [Bosea sp. ANAM02]BCB22390.1 hypothetical protein OCUBac02_52840 [Bosea sp. ANAM02]
MSENNQKTAIEHAQEELAAIDQALFALFIKREAFSDSMKKLAGVEPAPFVYKRIEYQKSEFVASFDANTAIEAARPEMAGGGVYRARHVNKRMVEEAIQIIVAAGRPMSTPEIMRTHSMRDQVSSEALYRLMYNRMVTGSLMSLNGAFWPVGRDLPASFDISRAKQKGNLAKRAKAAA